MLDVRSPQEFARGHIPHAVNLPLFTDQERADIGTTYKKIGQREAMLLGLKAVGLRIRDLSEEILLHSQHTNSALFYCWRGGLRSQSIAWLSELLGCTAYRLLGGYKAFREYIANSMKIIKYPLILGGATGVGKTAILQQLARDGHQVLDLEEIAHHRGSVFGGLGLCKQPLQQQFENMLGLQWRSFDAVRPIWIENESRCIGKDTISQPIWEQMRKAPMIAIDIPFDLRVQRLIREYGQFHPEQLKQAIRSLHKRLNPQHTQSAIAAIEQGDLALCCETLLRQYYDKAYALCLQKHTPCKIIRITSDTDDPISNAAKIINAISSLDLALPINDLNA